MGGHLELLIRLRECFGDYERVWVTASAEGAAPLLADGDAVWDVPRFNRSRPWSAAGNGFACLRAAVRERPEVVVVSGAGSVVAFCVFARLLGAQIVFVETMARVTSGSASGRVLSKIARKVLVQWPEMARIYRGAMVCRPVLWEDVRESVPRDRHGTVVAVGTHRHPFDRLLAVADRAVARDLLPGPVTAQAGASRYRPANYVARPWLSPDHLADAIARAEYVVCHAGSGILSAALRCGHKPLVVARRRARSEHVDDHQVQIVEKLLSLDLIVPVDGEISAGHLERARAGVYPRPAHAAPGPSLQDTLAREVSSLFNGSGAADPPRQSY
jgi:UDP-N-acetylglucosamine--N-acetylmuramyl-(pentapeptide) pyrophosphoryl-undecaprenol N-acetylglucosamine transferase